MSNWLLRGLVFAALMVIVRLLQGAMINAWETKAGLISIALIVVYAIVVFVWGLARRARRRARQPRPGPARRPGDDMAAGRPVRRHRQRGRRVVHPPLLHEPLRRGADQRAHHVRGVHRAAGVPAVHRGRHARPLPRRPQGAGGAAPRVCPCGRAGRHRRVRRSPPAGRRRRPPTTRRSRSAAPIKSGRRPGSAAPAGTPAHRGRRSRRSPRR